MKSAAAILLLVVIFLQTFTSFVIKANYSLNKEYIAAVLCINKDKPAMHCNGKCYLAKQLKEQQKQDQQAPNQKKEKFEIQPFFLPKQFSIAGIVPFKTIKYPYAEGLFSSSFLHSIFHPPTV